LKLANALKDEQDAHAQVILVGQFFWHPGRLS